MLEELESYLKDILTTNTLDETILILEENLNQRNPIYKPSEIGIEKSETRNNL